MSSSDPLERLLDLDSSSSEFPRQLADILLMEDCMNRAQTLDHNELMKFVENLDHVCGQNIFNRSLLNTIVGAQDSRPRRTHFFSLSLRTLEDLWRPRGPTNVT